MDEPREVSNIWTVLDSEPSAEAQLRVAPLNFTTVAGQLFAGIDADRNRHLLVPLFSGEAFSSDTSGRSVHLVRVRYEGVEYASAVCLNRDLDDVFGQFAREFIGTVLSSGAPGLHLRSSLDRWRTLFSEAVGGPMSPEEQLGLLGELTFVRRFLQIASNKSTEWWTGPDKLQHDFRWPGRAFEVKASRAREGRRVRISSLEQLNTPPSSTLYLGYLRFEQDPGSESLAELVDSIASIASVQDLYWKQLKATGYDVRDRDFHDKFRFRLTEMKIYDVSIAGFPRVVPSSFAEGAPPEGTEQFTYVVDLAGDGATAIDPADVDELLARLANSK